MLLSERAVLKGVVCSKEDVEQKGRIETGWRLL